LELFIAPFGNEMSFFSIFEIGGALPRRRYETRQFF